MSIAAGVRAAGTGSSPNIPHLTLINLPAGGFTDIPLDTEGADANQFGGSVQWAPDGASFAYTANDIATGQGEVRTCNRDGAGITTVLAASPSDSWAVYDWWPDGSALLISWGDVLSGAGKIMRCAADGSSLRTLYDDPTGTLINGGNTYLALSPDGATIAAVCVDSTLRTMPAGGGALTTIYTDVTFYPTPLLGCLAWRPEPRIVFPTPGLLAPRLYTINGDGSDLQQIGTDEGWFGAVWASDTQILAVENGGLERVHLMNLDGTHAIVPDSSQYWGGVKMSVFNPPSVPSVIGAGAGASGIVRLS